MHCTLYQEWHKRLRQTERQEIISQYKRWHISVSAEQLWNQSSATYAPWKCEANHKHCGQKNPCVDELQYLKEISESNFLLLPPHMVPHWGAAQAMLGLIWIVHRREELIKRLLFVCIKTLFSLLHAVKATRRKRKNSRRSQMYGDPSCWMETEEGERKETKTYGWGLRKVA